MSEEIRNYLSCEANFDSEGGWVGDVPNENQPPGRDLIEFLLSSIRPHTQSVSEIWNEEGYGWSFNCEKDRTTLNVLVQFVDHWLIICHTVSLVPRFLRSRRFDAALKRTCDEIDRAARADARFRELRWFTTAEYVEFEKKRHEKSKSQRHPRTIR